MRSTLRQNDLAYCNAAPQHRSLKRIQITSGPNQGGAFESAKSRQSSE